MTDHELATKLKELAEAPAPPPRIDLDRARRIGGRRRRVRTTALVLGCAAVVAAGGLTAVSVFRPVPPLATAPAAVAPKPAPVAPAPTDNPLVTKASFGWLPEPIKGIEYGVGGHGDYALAIGRGDLAPMIWLAVWDQEPALDRRHDMGGKAVRVPVRVGDREGYWVTVDAADPLNQGNSYLRWPTGDGRWAELNAYYLTLPELQKVLLRVAGDVTFANRAVPLPLHITGLPESFRVADVNLWRRPDTDGVPWRAVLQYSSNGALATITVSLPGGESDGLGTPVCTTKNGLQACVRIDQPSAAGITAKELLSRITLLGPDEAKWTTHVIG
ncbi:hypothetical protein SAMN04489727_2348 [Amycolatopsis tolypomycina]|uniref:Uncharacterized protein n=1 Tax=Amycolatopsis tolypomycina TaxID=208445 RepID=A0A1H4PAD7_9PSEU|nr:hypothetical protein [Amycolatopsis tolypomycina]SEC04416.1 hypothetical protein SAMN04489727_2348 [Amycolatopsis tolypomycina]